MLLPLAYYGNPVLRKKASPVEKIDDELRRLVADMIETMHHYRGIGLAAPQVHRSLALIITHLPEEDENGEVLPTKEQVFINPQVIEVSEKMWVHSEGCLSIPGIYEDIERPVRIRAEVTTLEEERLIIELSGWQARAFLHENDHINGVLFFDRVRGKRRLELEQRLRAVKKKFHKR